MSQTRSAHLRAAARALRERIHAGDADPRLLRRFGLYAALAVIVAAILSFVVVRREAVGSAEQNGLAHAQFVAESILADQLRPADLSGPVSPGRRRALDRLFADEVLPGSLRADVYGAGGAITYSTDHAAIGAAPALPAVAAALQGGTQSGPAVLAGHKVLATYVPIALRGLAPSGALELYEDYDPIAGAAQQLFIPLTALSFLILLGLAASFFPILRRTTRAMRSQMHDMEHQAFHDTLTGLPNRALFHDRVQQALRTARRENVTMAVMLMDLDRFKEINDTFGHQSGDEVLREVATHVRGPLRESDTVARLGGDEFAILATSVAGPMGAIALAERIHGALQGSYEVAGVEVDVDASIGIALFPHHGQDIDALLRCADVALYVSKEGGGPTLYAIEHDHHSAERLALSAQLRRAIVQREIAVYYQPKADFETGQVRSVEALARWEHAERGVLLPEQFVPLAEHAGLIRALTSHVLDVALKQASLWRADGLDLSLAVNITGQDLLDQRFADEVKGLLWKYDVNPGRLELEITENTVLTDPARAIPVLQSLSDLGVRLAIDDFGSGNSSLGYLQRLPINVLKIDKSFVLQMLASDSDAAIVRSTIELGHNLGLQVVAEGVESAATWDRLHRLGCDVGQGYHLSRPVPGSALARVLARPSREAGRAPSAQ